MSILKCEVSVHAQPADATTLENGELSLPTNWANAPWGRTFDDALAALGDLPQLYTEPDGSFVWTSPPDVDRWQLFGCLYDRGRELAYVDLFGSCESTALRQLFDCLRGPVTSLMLQLRERGVFVGEVAFLHTSD